METDGDSAAVSGRLLLLAQVMADHAGWESEATRLEELLTKLSKKVGKGFVISKVVAPRGVEQVRFTTFSQGLLTEFEKTQRSQ